MKHSRVLLQDLEAEASTLLVGCFGSLGRQFLLSHIELPATLQLAVVKKKER